LPQPRVGLLIFSIETPQSIRISGNIRLAHLLRNVAQLLFGSGNL